MAVFGARVGHADITTPSLDSFIPTGEPFAHIQL